jgi:Xaa-Pro aminopeptidase
VLALAAPGVPFQDLHDLAVRKLTEGMVRIGLLEGEVDELITEETYKRFYMHKTGHWLGLDVHDVGRYFLDGQSRPLEPGMLFTVEPGIYVAPDDEAAPEQYRGIGVRIEDDVLVVDGGVEVLSARLPRDADTIEGIVGSA